MYPGVFYCVAGVEEPWGTQMDSNSSCTLPRVLRRPGHSSTAVPQLARPVRIVAQFESFCTNPKKVSELILRIKKIGFIMWLVFMGETKVALNNVESSFRVNETEVYALEIHYATTRSC